MRGSHGNAAAMAFEAKIGTLTVRIIDVMTFNDLKGGGSKPIGFNCKLPPKYKLLTIFWAEPVATSTP